MREVPAPQWASDLKAKVLGRRKGPRLIWKLRSAASSSGVCFYSGRIIVRAGTDEHDAKMVLLHELAHWLTGEGHHHDKAFWKRAFKLYEAHGLDISKCVAREKTYWKAAATYGRT